jgi:hypothetical protein
MVFMTFVASTVFSQKISKNIVDDFTGGKVIYTSWETLNMGNFGTNHLFFRFRYENNMVYFHLKWITDGVTSVNKDANIIFKFNNDSICTLHSLSYTLAERGGGAVGISMSAMMGLDLIYVGNEMNLFLTDHYVSKIRIYTTDGYVDMNIKEGNAMKINTAYKLLMEAMKK